MIKKKIILIKIKHKILRYYLLLLLKKKFIIIRIAKSNEKHLKK